MKSMILAAGYGKRLGNLTKDTPKPLIEVKGKALIDFHIEKLIAIGCKKIVINVHYLAEKIINHVSAKYIDAIDIVFSHEENILGTGGGIKNAVKHFDQDDFLVINSDIYSDLDYSYFNNFFSPTVFSVLSDKEQEGDFSIESGKVKVSDDKNFTWTGFSIINAKLFNNIEEKSFHYWHDCLLKIAKRGNLKADILDINWYDVGSIDTLELLNSE
ncbi:MAG: nucleotidyltransferase family protein [Amoebophilaceae bacterium TMED152]|mgnify:FL=1|nr:nucleotidyl transferase [Gammaproteobacteria bacterium]RPH01987.1 MAG: nucleotidyltransferase family protein [Amoebophilaceae bacterium TMED152]|tara:strand:+ start:14599 stop:15243 length:645 start_codon:yes stop_codon:yes gene_type:complete